MIGEGLTQSCFNVGPASYDACPTLKEVVYRTARQQVDIFCSAKPKRSKCFCEKYVFTAFWLGTALFVRHPPSCLVCWQSSSTGWQLNAGPTPYHIGLTLKQRPVFTDKSSVFCCGLPLLLVIYCPSSLDHNEWTESDSKHDLITTSPQPPHPLPCPAVYLIIIVKQYVFCFHNKTMSSLHFPFCLVIVHFPGSSDNRKRCWRYSMDIIILWSSAPRVYRDRVQVFIRLTAVCLNLTICV